LTLKEMTITGKLFEALRQDGPSGLSRKAALYLSRRAGGRASELTRKLDYSVNAQSIYRQARPLLARNEIFRGRHSGRPGFVLGNGPSINEQDLRPLAQEVTFVTNAFCRHPIVEEWQPSYYFLTDPVYYDGSDARRDDFTGIKERVPASTYFVPYKAREYVERESLLPLERTYYVALAGNLAHDPPWKPDFTLVQPDVRTVVQLAIIGAMFMGCSPIYLLGLDHDWLAHAHTHYTFYTGQEAEQHDWKYGDLMEAVLIMWRGYESIRRVAAAEGISILNATRGGFLDVFERAEYESVIRAGTSIHAG
jgi:hypothetical protein